MFHVSACSERTKKDRGIFRDPLAIQHVPSSASSSSDSTSESSSSSSKIELSSVASSSMMTGCITSNVWEGSKNSPERKEVALVRVVTSVEQDLRPPWPSDIVFPVFTGCLLSLAREDCSDPMLKDCLGVSGRLLLTVWLIYFL